MVGDDVWHQREKTWICFVLGAPSDAFQAEERAIAAVIIDMVVSPWMKDAARHKSVDAFLAFFQSLYRRLNLFSILFLFFSLQNRHKPTGGMENCLNFKKVLLCYLDALVGNKRRSKRLGPLKPWNSNAVHHVALSAAQENQPELSCGGFPGRMYFNAWTRVLSVGVGRRGALMFNTDSTNTLQLRSYVRGTCNGTHITAMATKKPRIR